MKTRKPSAVAEIVFDLAYLAFAAIAGIVMYTQAQSHVGRLYGVLALVLCGGDAFHLLPRVYSLWTSTMAEHAKLLSLGKLITSLTMTQFYVILYHIWQMLFWQSAPALTATIYILAGVRMVLCVLPQNGWSLPKPSFRFAIYRNIPFAILGAIIAGLFIWKNDNNFAYMPLAIAVSFLFYFLVVLFAGKNKKFGMLMIPKTCAYIWIIYMGFSLL